MKVLIVVESHYKEYGGPYTAISQTVKYLNDRKIKNKLIYENSNNFKYNLDLKYIIRDFDIIHIYGIWRPFLIKVFIIAKLLKKKIVISPIGALEPWSLEQKKLKKKIAWLTYQRLILNNSDIIHTTSDIEAKNIINKNIKAQIEIIAHGLEVDKNFQLSLKKNKKKKILFFSRIHSKKGLIELISVWKDIKNYRDWELHIYGPISDNNYFKEMIKEIKKRKLEENIYYFDPVFKNIKKKKIFNDVDGFILPSKSENFGISIGEALARGLPVLTTYETPWKIINEYNAGYVFNFSKDEIKKNLEIFMNLSDEQRFEMGKNALNIIIENFESSKIFKKYETLYTNLMK